MDAADGRVGLSTPGRAGARQSHAARMPHRVWRPAPQDGVISTGAGICDAGSCRSRAAVASHTEHLGDGLVAADRPGSSEDETAAAPDNGRPESATATTGWAPDSPAEDTRARPQSRTSARPRLVSRLTRALHTVSDRDRTCRSPWHRPRPDSAVGHAAVEWLKTHIHQTMAAVRHQGAAVRRTLDHWLDTIAESLSRGGASTIAALRAVDAALTGKNPVWAAIKGLVSGLSRRPRSPLSSSSSSGCCSGRFCSSSPCWPSSLQDSPRPGVPPHDDPVPTGQRSHACGYPAPRCREPVCSPVGQVAVAMRFRPAGPRRRIRWSRRSSACPIGAKQSGVGQYNVFRTFDLRSAAEAVGCVENLCQRMRQTALACSMRLAVRCTTRRRPRVCPRCRSSGHIGPRVALRYPPSAGSPNSPSTTWTPARPRSRSGSATSQRPCPAAPSFTNTATPARTSTR